jgi:RNA polymerase sigma-70 factor (ECF subfamily)
MPRTTRPPEASGSDTSLSLIVRLGRQGDDETWARFVHRYGPRILGWCRAWGLQDADVEDLTQIVLSKLLVEFRRFAYDPSRSFRAWLRTLTRNAWRDSLRARRREHPGQGSEALARIAGLQARDDLERRLAEEFDLELLEMAQNRVQARVEPRTWDAYRLIAVERLSGAEAAARLGMPAAHVFVAKRNVLRLLKQEIALLEARQAEL